MPYSIKQVDKGARTKAKRRRGGHAFQCGEGGGGVGGRTHLLLSLVT